MATCNTCRAEYNWGENPCWRCGEDNGYWERRRTLPRVERFWDFFGNVWGIMAFLMLVIPLVSLVYNFIYGLWTAGLSEQKAGLLAAFLALFLSFIAITFVYAMRFQLWNYSWIRNIRWKKTPPVIAMAASLFLLGVVILLTYLSILMFYRWAPRSAAVGFDFAGFFEKIIVPTLYSLIFLSFATASMLMSAGLYIARLNENVGQPIYMNTNLLTEVVKKAVLNTLKIPVVLIVANLERTDRGGIRVLFNQIGSGTPPSRAGAGPPPVPPKPAPAKTVQVERRYEVEANEWGQIQTLIEQPVDSGD